MQYLNPGPARDCRPGLFLSDYLVTDHAATALYRNVIFSIHPLLADRALCDTFVQLYRGHFDTTPGVPEEQLQTGYTGKITPAETAGVIRPGGMDMLQGMKRLMLFIAGETERDIW